MEFKYIAIDKKGKKKSNMIEADSRQEAINSLKSGGLKVIKLKLKKESKVLKVLKQAGTSINNLAFKVFGGKLKAKRLESFKEELEILGYDSDDISKVMKGINKDNFNIDKYKERFRLTDIQIEKINTGKISEQLVRSTGDSDNVDTKIKFRLGVPEKDVINFTEMLAVLLDNDVVMIDALETIQKNITNKKLGSVIDSIVYDLTKGREFSVALSNHRDVFPALYVSMVGVGEKTGSELPRALEDVVKFMKMKQRIKREFIQAMIYPGFVVVALIGILIFLNMYLIPRFRDLFNSMDFEMPVLTKFIFGISENLTLIIMGVFLAGILGVYTFYKFEYTRLRVLNIFDTLSLKIPIIKNAVMTSLMYKITLTLSVTLRNGISIQESLDLLNGLIGNRHLKKEIGEIYYSLEKGKDMSDAFGDKKHITDIVKMAVSSGEKSGRLSETLDKVSVYYEKELDAKIAVLLQTIVPVSIILLASVIAPFIIGIYLPLISLTDQMGNMN